MPQHHRLARVEVGRGGTIGYRQRVEVFDSADAKRLLFKQRQDSLPLQDARRKAHLPIADANPEGSQSIAVILLAAKGAFRSG
ncbi:hypothetical protein D3C81_1704290 [compost metagenome]